MPSPNTPRLRAKGWGWRRAGPGPGGDKQHGLAAGAGGCGHRGRLRGWKKALDVPRGVLGRGKAGAGTAGAH